MATKGGGCRNTLCRPKADPLAASAISANGSQQTFRYVPPKLPVGLSRLGPFCPKPPQTSGRCHEPSSWYLAVGAPPPTRHAARLSAGSRPAGPTHGEFQLVAAPVHSTPS